MKNSTKDKTQSISYEKFIAGALLNLETIDNVDFSLLVEDIEKKADVDFTGSWYYAPNIGGHICALRNGNIKLKNNVSLDDFIKEENCTLKEKFTKVSGNIVNDYFKNFDIEEYSKKKENLLKENKGKILNTANVLLISDTQEDYDELIKYGFKKVNYFKSIVRADKFFSEHPEELEKYHIILTGHQSVDSFKFSCANDLKLTDKIRKLRDKKHVLETSLRRYEYNDYTKLVVSLVDNKNWKSCSTEELSYSNVFDKILENTLINKLTEKIDIKTQKFSKYKDYVNPNRLSLPTKKSDLKILYLDSVCVNKYALDIANELGLNITFKEDSNPALEKYVRDNLGNYDVIIASDLYSSNLLYANNESTEQCKDTGRDLTLLVTYSDDSIWSFDEDDICDNQGFGNRINLRYIYGGNLAPTSECTGKGFRVLRQDIESSATDEWRRKYDQTEYSDMKAIIESSINLYNDALLHNEKDTIYNLDFKTAEEFDSEYDVVDKKEKERKNKALAPIRAFDNMYWEVTRYLENKKAGLTNKTPEGLKITESKSEIKVENIYEGRTLCSIIFSKNSNTHKNLRTFKMQTLTKKGTLSNPEPVGVYTRKYEKEKNIPNRPDEKQANILFSMQKKINSSISPLNVKIFERINNKGKQKKLNKTV